MLLTCIYLNAKMNKGGDIMFDKEYAVAKGIEEIADEDVKQCYFN